ncbi:nucleotide sugar dehydrogenase [Isachenkonia alkalipeptolytica]|uniref:Nucleotide sugar dehydrogenase n=1 Tax=Isachenkonia alkalipeptolytica TaxID=2565777 RepID=A0AA44BFV4_9CLOT|nr:nucleotide sugar dehydrogenase [Isachenkonia alkalipeptolytica]NBG88886.1 nucleotide sugar dehydrogenase [Isachenkonia alkalipeptolytica]
MNMYQDIVNRKEKISVIGLGYVGLPLVVEFAKKFDVVGYDTNKEKLAQYHKGIDVTDEVGDEALQASTAVLTDKEEDIKECRFHVVAVPTPINADKTPDLTPVIKASETVGRNLTKGSVVVYESTVYPGTTEEICIPILEKISGLTFGKDFTVGYSPERINPGDKVNTLTKIVKVVSGSDEASLDLIAKVYEAIIEAGVHRAQTIKVAEASKVIENSQRDINIAFMNELAMVFNKMNINTQQVLEAAGTKWNFLKFTPGLVGGHCIGVDPYYFTYKAEQLGYHSQIILAGRKINDGMGKYVAENTIKKLIKSGKIIQGSKVGILGITFKENCGDVRNTKVIDIIKELEEYDLEVLVHDPVADREEVEREYGITLCSKEEMKGLSAVVFAVAHDEFKQHYDLKTIGNMYGDPVKVMIDVKGIMDPDVMEQENYHYWSL